MIKPVILWTDALVFLLVVIVVAFALYARRHEHLRAPWREVVKGRIAIASLVVLAFYTLTGLLDSMHYRKALPVQNGQVEMQYAGEVVSVLDDLLGGVGTQVEKTYSAPFATTLYTRETVVDEKGVSRRIFPRLKYGGAHLENPERDRAADIARRSLKSAGQAVLVMLGLTVVLSLLLARHWTCSAREAVQRILRGKTEVPWRTGLFTLFLFALLAALIVNLASAWHVLGTDKVGKDVLYQTIKSIRTGLVIGTLTTLVMLPFAVFLGMMAGYFRGWVDDVIQYLYTTLNSIPGVLLIAASVLMMQVYMDTHPELFETMAERADLRLLFLCLILGITSWTGLCRLLRGETLKLRELDYVQAANAFGVPRLVIMVRHLLPNLMHLVLIAVVIDFSGLVLAEAVLSYVGVGVDPTTMSWGNMINRARLEMAREPMVWWSLLAAFTFMFTLVLAANLFSDAVRDAFDPRMRR
ncbi:peptide/nickel transport system permease protein [Thiogranum longum]|uniref:Peptide/nickel transport system permease protein n=1 Tax=Thiogranum longum TaxID=1537524 RepID=A0A4R1HBA9_9GAMM|nr:ABC transporter permease [Thiogranum longum]TCK17803.1 peptide/nickel transport system permease protein [Thiogranum longum]